MTPNNPIPEEKKKKIPMLLEKYSIGKTAKDLGICKKTVKKYAKKDPDF
jgi:hypothetical protein